MGNPTTENVTSTASEYAYGKYIVVIFRIQTSALPRFPLLLLDR